MAAPVSTPPATSPPPQEPAPPPPSLPPSAPAGAAIVNWTPPTQNVDGSALIDLAGFRIHYGTSQDSLERSIDIPNPGLTSYSIENLGAATWFFGVTAYTRRGVESDLSVLGSKTIQ